MILVLLCVMGMLLLAGMFTAMLTSVRERPPTFRQAQNNINLNSIKQVFHPAPQYRRLMSGTRLMGNAALSAGGVPA